MPQRTEFESARNISRMPDWIRLQLGDGKDFGHTHAAVAKNQLHTVCEEARCPNRGECWSRGTATFILLGDICTRACGFCSVKTGRPGAVDLDEPRRIADAVERLGLHYVVLTSVNRDDQKDKGVGIFAATLSELRQREATIGIEFLTPDFQGQQQICVDTIADALERLPLPPNSYPVWYGVTMSRPCRGCIGRRVKAPSTDTACRCWRRRDNLLKWKQSHLLCWAWVKPERKCWRY